MGIALATVAIAGPAQTKDQFKARLSWVPVGGLGQIDVAAKGTVTAVLTARTLSITGNFEGLSVPATAARLHRGVAKGARGPSIAELTATKAAAGTITGACELTADQVEDLRRGRLYIQVHSQKGVPPDGSTLWGWLIPN
jgi:hypothetical protein